MSDSIPAPGTWFKAKGEYFRRVNNGEPVRDFGGIVGECVRAGECRQGGYGFAGVGPAEWVRIADITAIGISETAVEEELIRRNPEWEFML